MSEQLDWKSLWLTLAAWACALVLFLLMAERACAEPPSGDFNQAMCAQEYPLVQGQRAPCEGLLMPPADAAQALRCLRADLPECRSEASELKIQKADLQRLLALERAEATRTARKRDGVARRAAGIKEPCWLTHPATLVSIGLIVGGLGGWGLAELVHR